MTGVSNHSSNYSATIHIWDTTINKNTELDSINDKSTVGHAAIELQGPKTNNYFSFRPKNPLFVNPFLFFMPTSGRSFLNTKEDCMHEGSGIEGKEADRKIVIPLSREQHEKMSEKIDSMKTEAEKGQLLYHLFPRISLLPAVKALASKRGYEELSSCPFSGQSMKDDRYKDMEEIQKVRSSHCALTVKEILSSGNIEIPASVGRYAPWGLTPTELGETLKDKFKENRLRSIL